MKRKITISLNVETDADFMRVDIHDAAADDELYITLKKKNPTI